MPSFEYSLQPSIGPAKAMDMAKRETAIINSAALFLLDMQSRLILLSRAYRDNDPSA
jgi:hypothetical protein